MSHKKVEFSSWGVRQISMLIYLGRKNLHTFPHFVYGGRIECCDYPRFNYKALFWLTCLAWIMILFHRIQQHGRGYLHVTEDRIQSLVRGMVGELFVPDNRPRQDQQFGATEDDHEIYNRFCLPRTRAEQQCHSCQLAIAVDAVKQCKWSCYYFTCTRK
jgi:hypothetical protein